MTLFGLNSEEITYYGQKHVMETNKRLSKISTT